MGFSDFLRAMFGITPANAEAVKRTAPVVAATLFAAATPFIVSYEGFTNPKTVNGVKGSVAIHQSFDPKDVYTYCSGLTNYDDPSVKPGMFFSKDVCDKKFQIALQKYWKMVQRQIPAADTFPQKRQIALLSFTYNVGEGNLKKSSVRRYLNAGNVQRGCDALLPWNKAAGRVLPGLVKRREAERKLCLAG